MSKKKSYTTTGRKVRTNMDLELPGMLEDAEFRLKQFGIDVDQDVMDQLVATFKDGIYVPTVKRVCVRYIEALLEKVRKHG